MEVGIMSNNEVPLVVVGADGSELGVAAIRWAAEHARRVGGRLRVVTAYEVPGMIFFAPTARESEYEDAAKQALARSVAEALGEAPDLPVEELVLAHRPAHALTEAADGAALLVVGSHGRGQLPGMHLGSVASYCVHHAPCPVLVYRTATSGR
jgi:nucleotide-binding universal stress UspA family protein